jgi:hypothetical protein
VGGTVGVVRIACERTEKPVGGFLTAGLGRYFGRAGGWVAASAILANPATCRISLDAQPENPWTSGLRHEDVCVGAVGSRGDEPSKYRQHHCRLSYVECPF